MPGELNGIIYKFKSSGVYHFKIIKHTLYVELRYKNKVVVKFQDELLNTGNLTEFKRIINNNIYYFKDGFVVYRSLTFKKPYIDPIFKSPNLSHKFICEAGI